MKKILIVGLFLLAAISAKTQTRFTVSDSLAVGTTARDTTFTYPWEMVEIWFDGFSSSTATGLLRFGISSTDTLGRGHATTTHVKLRRFMPMQSSQIKRITANAALGISGLKWCEFKMSSGTGYIYFNGTKKTDQ